VLFVVVGLLVFVLAAKPNQPEDRSVAKILQEAVNPSPEPTPFLFEELTIPYLRNRVYKSELGELTKYQDNESFTSYLTSYDSDGLKINGLLTIPKGLAPRSPKGEAGWPAIVFVHGYIAPLVYKTTERYMDHVNYLARNGFVVFKIDLRGHGDSEGEPGGGYYSGDYVVDTLNAYAALQGSGFVDPNGIGLWGHSMSGNVVLRALVAKKDVSAIVVWAGAGYTYSDLQEYQIDDNSYRPPPTDSAQTRKRQKLRETYGSFDPNHWFWKQVPATNYLDEVMGAIEIHHAVDDNVVSVRYSENLMNILDNTSIAHELYKYPSGGHNITGSSFSSAIQRTVEFYKRNLE
jgi:dipeptidyl aminopeptidase/acylaminoacyl peptidase